MEENNQKRKIEGDDKYRISLQDVLDHLTKARSSDFKGMKVIRQSGEERQQIEEEIRREVGREEKE